MKLRLEKNTVKIRLSKESILKLHSDGFLEDQIMITEENFISYAVEIIDDIESCDLQFGSNTIEIGIPSVKAEKWIKSNQVALKEEIETDNGDTVVLIIEEDLPPRTLKTS